MRPHFLAAVATLLGFAGPVAAQDTTVPPLERIIDLSIPVPTAVSDCTVPTAVARLARRFHVIVGVEYLKSECARIGGERRSNGALIDLKGLTIEDAFAKLLAMDPRYQMIEREGVFVVRPVQAWGDPKNMLNFMSGSFTLEDATLGIALDTVLSAIVGDRPSLDDRFGSRTEQGARRFSVKTSATSAGGALDAIVRAHGAAWWEVREGEVGRLVSLYTFDGTGIGSSRKGLQ